MKQIMDVLIFVKQMNLIHLIVNAPKATAYLEMVSLALVSADTLAGACMYST